LTTISGTQSEQARDTSAALKVDLATIDPDEAHAWLSDRYMPLSAYPSGDPRRFRARHASADIDSLSINRFEYAMATRMKLSPPGDSVLVVHTVSGRYGVAAREGSVVAEPGDAVVLNPDAVHFVHWPPDVHLVTWAFDRTALERVAAERLGTRAGRLRFPLSRLVPEKKRPWQEFVRRVNHELLADDARTAPLVRSRTFRLAAVTLLDCFANSSLLVEHAGEGRAGLATLRRAIAFIEESADQDIDMAMIAEAARTEPSQLCQAFRDQLGSTPMTYVERVRLDCAHNELRVASPATGACVRDIAVRWGFLPGRFAAKYHQRFGCLPGDTFVT
jgi:AraC-like DNA-binding protein